MIFPVVAVEWVDSHTDNDWTPLREARRVAGEKHAMLMRTCGFLIASEPDYIVVAGTYSAAVDGDDDLVNCTIQIPRACIIGDPRELYRAEV